MDYINILQKMLHYIDTHINEKMNVEKLAKQAGFSPYHFCRMFQSGVGSSIMEYVRNRRLAYAASELGSERKIVDIAVDYGFDTHSGFSKAFRRYFGCPPEIYRNYATFDVPNLPDLTKTSQFESTFVIEPKIIAKKKTFKLAGFTHTIDPNNIKVELRKRKKPDGISKFREDCRADGRMEKLHNEPFLKYHAEYGACIFSKSEDEETVYFFGVEVKAKHNIPNEYQVYVIPETKFAVFTTYFDHEDDFSSKIAETWQFIISEWLPNSGYELNTNSIAYELYDDRSMNNAEKTCDIYFPIINREL